MKRLMLAMVLIAGHSGSVQARDVSTEIGLYGFGVAIDSEIGIGDTTIETDLSFSEIWDALEGVLLVYLEHRRDDLVFFWRSEYMDLAFDSTARRGPLQVSTEVGLAQWTHQGFVGYRFQRPGADGEGASADILGGFRYVDIDTSADVNLALLGQEVSRRFDRAITFTDPVVAIRGVYRFASGWGLAGWADVGGFGLGSEYSTSIEVNVDRLWDNGWRVFAGYRYFTFEYEDSTRDGDLTFRPTYTGPLLGVSYRF